MNKQEVLTMLIERDSEALYQFHKGWSARMQGAAFKADVLEWERLDSFLAKTKVNGYFHFTELNVYIRVTERVLEGIRRPTVDLANVTAQDTGKGHFSKWLYAFEDLVQKHKKSLYIENVLTERFAAFWEKRPGYRAVETNSPDRCYWKPFSKYDEEKFTDENATIFTIQDHLKEIGFESSKAHVWHRGPVVALLSIEGDHTLIFTPSPELNIVFRAAFTNSPKSCAFALSEISSEAEEWFICFQQEMMDALMLPEKEVSKNVFET